MRVNKKSLLAVGAAAVVATLGLAGCSTGSGDNNQAEAAGGTLTVWVDAERVDALQAAADAYSEEKGVEVELVGKDNADIKDDFIQQVPTGKGPDITMGAHDWLGELSTNGVVAPIELGDSAADYLPVAIDASTYEGTTYMLPYAVENIAVLRNADLVPEAATSFDDMIAKGKAAGLDHPFVVEQGAEGNPYHLYPFQTAFGAPVFGTNDEGYDPTDLQLGNAGGEEFATWLGAQGKNGTGNFNTDIDGDIAKQAFLDGTAAFWLTGPWNVGAAIDGGVNVAIDTVPSPTGEAASPFAGVKGFFVSSESANKVAANDFLVNYIGTEDVQLELFEAGNILPALSAAAETASSDPIIEGFAAVGAEAVPMPAIPAMGSVWQYWGIAEAGVINGADPVATWQKLTSDVQAAISK
ncbi:maltose ABC transporter substrate-binding protein [Agromyces sp. SYSU K20354]|uniref:sugar ABC transporter substrate-binding protein n=1 Tax=Agromyces cavernae TaxID=2898659 RepID=UPI001E54C9E8|nr:maltose ABC transporter substrate-binding protein [Agromyces cavernae]MCD2443451.1 maltose ABC transporter substrate-binding protein [Agromyces cavernae]